jgi:hypothetical protein
MLVPFWWLLGRVFRRVFALLLFSPQAAGICDLGNAGVDGEKMEKEAENEESKDLMKMESMSPGRDLL